ncbi:hypothetical protein SKAU_G00095840 [Synaphobranchus kaupii]|uniref:Tc1-like transposase DDE domain-containing protein n=1 Tax=Synaphobranchus kaupii TaxID=118154 RepID=A0A9Q1J6X4_SYNKA|nr:hypothetical protein SKAU_G00095840 [Synaphobranchus kaupii]
MLTEIPKRTLTIGRCLWVHTCNHSLTSYTQDQAPITHRARLEVTFPEMKDPHPVRISKAPTEPQPVENSPDLNPIENLWGIVKRKMRDTRPNNADDLKAAIKTTWTSITPQQCHRLIASMPRRIDAVIHAKGAPTKH